MTKVLVTRGSLEDTAGAIRTKLGVQTTYKPSQFAAAIGSITGVTSADNGKVVVNGALTEQTSKSISMNGTYDTTTNNQVIVNVSGGLVPDGFTYYNGYLLPTLPVVNDYPYIVIRKNDSSGKFDALYSQTVWYTGYITTNYDIGNWFFGCSGLDTNGIYWYTAPQTNPSSWTPHDNGNVFKTANGFGTSENRNVIWSSHDILKESESGPIVYKHGNSIP